MTTLCHKTTTVIGGMTMPVTVFFRITSYGSLPSYMEPGDPVEIEIEEIFRDSDDKEMLSILDSSFIPPYWVSVSLHQRPELDPIRQVLTGVRSWPRDVYYCESKLSQAGRTLLNLIEDEILSTESYFIPPHDFGD